MERITKTITVSIQPEMDAQIEKLMRLEGRTRSELLGGALRGYMRDREWREVVRYGKVRSRCVGIAEEEIEDIADVYRR